MSTHTPRPFIRALRAASPSLWPARLRLMSLKVAYKSGSYSGHPATMLDAMDGVERLIWQRTNGIRPAVAAPAPVTEPVTAGHVRSLKEQREYEEFTAP